MSAIATPFFCEETGTLYDHGIPKPIIACRTPPRRITRWPAASTIAPGLQRSL
jgi:hypothetical protein